MREVAADLIGRVAECADELGIPAPSVKVEPGRAIAGPSTVTLYEVGSVKDVHVDTDTTRRYVAVDGGMSDNIRPALYGAQYKASVNGKNGIKETVTLCGKCCESGDLIIKDISLPQIQSGDLILIYSTGAYGYSMSSNYNHLPRPAVVFVEKDHHQEVVRRKTYKI